MSISLPQLCYDVAYFILPHYAHQNRQKIVQLCTAAPAAAGPFFYITACLHRKIEPIKSDADSLRWHVGDLDANTQHYVLEFPTPPPVDLSKINLADKKADPPVLAPYFAAILIPRAGGPSQYLILGQAPLGGGTTLRSVLPDHSNCNLGPGPKPTLPAFLDHIRSSVKQ